MDSAKKPPLSTVQMREALAKLEKGNADTGDVIRCPRCKFQFSHKPSKKGKIVGALAGAAAGAARVAKGGFAGGRIGTIARILPSILQGAVSGSMTGGHFDKPVCPKCSARFE